MKYLRKRIEASFNKSRNSNATAKLHTFNLQEQLFSMYIPVKASDIIVYKYQDRPMIFNDCHKCGQRKNKMQTKINLSDWAEEDHTSDKPNECPNESKRANCGDGNMAGSNDYEVKTKKR